MAVSIKSASKPCRLVQILCVMGLGVLSACANPEPGAEYLDPYEVDNRAVHEANKQLDREFVRPVAAAYGRIVPVPVQRGVSNFSNNLDTPGLMVNNLLQFDIANLARNGLRFAVNTTVGIAGLFDPASSMGISRKDTDFGQTLDVWGLAKEGNYVELPLLGPSTERDAVGKIVDAAMNPLGAVLPKATVRVGQGAWVATKLGERNRFGHTIDSVLYDSADSYAQSRLLYLQNRRFELGQSNVADYFDPYEDMMGQ
jgi:phospholipid-binding lipoprotein MlaA